MQASPFNQQNSQQVFSSYSSLLPAVMIPPVQPQQIQQPDQLSLLYILQSQQQQQQQQSKMQQQFSQQQPVAYFQSIPGYSQGQLISIIPAMTLQQQIVGQQLIPQQNMINNGLCYPMIGQQQTLCLLPTFTQQQSNKQIISCDFSQQQSLNSLSTFSSLQNYSSEISQLNQMTSIETSSVQDNNQVKTETIIEAPRAHSSQIPQPNIQIINNKQSIAPSLNQNQPSLRHPLIQIINKKPSIKSAVTSSENSSSEDGSDDEAMNLNKDSLSSSDEVSIKQNHQNSSKAQDAQVNSSLPIRNNEDPYKTYKYPSQIQNQLRKQVLKRFFKSVPGYLDTLESHISEQFQDLDKAAVKAMCKYWSQFDNPARRTQLKNKEYRQLCNQLQVNSEIKPLGQKCLKEIFGKNNHFSDALRYLYQEFNKDANAFAHRKKNLGMQHKYVQASNRIYHDIFNE